MIWIPSQVTQKIVNCYRVYIKFIHLLHGEVNSVKNITINVWLNDGVY